MNVSALRTTATFAQLDVRLDTQSVVVDLVADRPRSPKPPVLRSGNATILVETPYQLLVNKLCALLSRSELRDLIDVHVLIESGLDLTRAIADCPGQDAAFSPLTFAWSARALPIRRVAAAQGWSDTEIAALEQFRDDLVIAESQPNKPM